MMIKKRKKIVSMFMLVLVIGVFFTQKALAGNDTVGWHGMKWKILDTKNIDGTIFNQYRTYHDLEDSQFNLNSIQLKYDFIKNISFGTNYTYINTKVNNSIAGRSEYKFQHRLELEVNPYYNLTNWLKFAMRNRVEFRWIEDNGTFNTRTRHNFKFIISLKDKTPIPGLNKLFISTEAFYNYANHRYEEQRTVPISLSFDINKKLGFELYYLIQSRATSVNTDWYDNYVVGTNFLYKF